MGTNSCNMLRSRSMLVCLFVAFGTFSVQSAPVTEPYPAMPVLPSFTANMDTTYSSEAWDCDHLQYRDLCQQPNKSEPQFFSHSTRSEAARRKIFFDRENKRLRIDTLRGGVGPDGAGPFPLTVREKLVAYITGGRTRVSVIRGNCTLYARDVDAGSFPVSAADLLWFGSAPAFRGIYGSGSAYPDLFPFTGRPEGPPGPDSVKKTPEGQSIGQFTTGDVGMGGSEKTTIEVLLDGPDVGVPTFTQVNDEHSVIPYGSLTASATYSQFDHNNKFPDSEFEIPLPC